MKRNVLNSPRLLELKKKKQRVVLNKILLSLVALAVIFAGLVYISRIPSLNITSVEVIGNKVVDNEMIKTNVEKEITGNYLWFFPKTNILYYPKNNIKGGLGNQFKRLKNITLSIKDSRVLEASVIEREPKYTWCGTTLDLEIKPSGEEECYFLDETGFIFDEAPYFSGEVYFKFYGPTSESYFSKQNFEQLISFKNNLIAMGLKPVVLYILDNEDVKVFLSAVSTATVPEIIFKIDSSLENVVENLQAALTTEPLQSNFKNKYSSLEYIDLRFGNKVYYKFQ